MIGNPSEWFSTIGNCGLFKGHRAPFGVRVPVHYLGAMSMGQEFIQILFLFLSSLITWASFHGALLPEASFHSYLLLSHVHHFKTPLPWSTEEHDGKIETQTLQLGTAITSASDSQFGWPSVFFCCLWNDAWEQPRLRSLCALRTQSLTEPLWTLPVVPLCTLEYVLVKLFHPLSVTFFPH